jgi:hypothetical protein
LYPGIDDFKPPNYMNDFSNLTEIALASVATTNATPPSGAGKTTNGTIQSDQKTPPTTASEQPFWTKPEIFVPITVAIIGSIIGPLVVSRYGKKHRSTDNTE